MRAQALRVPLVQGEHAGEVVGKDELMQRVWGDVVVTEDSLVQAVGDIRRALGDQGHRQVRTVPRRRRCRSRAPCDLQALRNPGCGGFAWPCSRQESRDKERMGDLYLPHNDLPSALTLRARRAFSYLTLLCSAVLIAACGGGGGAGGGGLGPTPSPSPVPGLPTPTPAPALVVTAGVTSASAGDAPIPLHADVVGATGTPTWELQGPGTLTSTTGTDVKYIPPDTESLDDAATAVIYATVGTSLSQHVQIGLTPVALAGQHWSVVRPAASTWKKVVHANGTFVALDKSNGTISHSVDGMTWTRLPLTGGDVLGFDDLVWGGAGWVAVDQAGHTATSADGKTWTVHKGAMKPGAYRVVTGNQIYLAYGGGESGTRVSSDGVNWQESGAYGFIGIAHGNGRFIGIGGVPTVGPMPLSPYASTDGINWYAVTDPGAMSSIVFRTNDFAGHYFSTLSVTSEGLTWISTSDSTWKGGELGYAGGALFEYNTDTLGVALDGLAPLQVTVGDALSQPASIAFGAGKYVGVSSMGWISSSTDALHWSTVLEGSVGNLTAVDFFNGSYIALSDVGWALRSADAMSWVRSEVEPHASIHSPAFSAMAMTHGGGTLVAVGRSHLHATTGMWMRSTDGITWLPATTSAPPTWVTSVTHDGQRFVAVDRSGNVHESPDGDHWSGLGAVPGQPELAGIVYGNGVYVAVGRPGVIASSTDGSNWTTAPPIPSTVEPHITAATMSAVTWDGKRFIAVGPDRVSATSTDGLTWTAGTTGLPAATVAAANGRIVAADRGAAMSSIDGLHWRTRVWSDTRTTGASSVTYAQGRFIGVGPNSVIAVSDR